MYEIQLHVAEFQGPVVDTSTMYARGEENRQGWRLRQESLIYDHQEQLTKLRSIEEVFNSTLYW